MAQGGDVPPQQPHYRSLVFNYLVFASLGIGCSILFNSYYGIYDDLDKKLRFFQQQSVEYSLKEVRSTLQGTNCEDVLEEAKMPDSLKEHMGTKLRYQFEPVISDETTIGKCSALKVYGLIRHGSRYPTSKHLAKMVALEQSLPGRLADSTGNTARLLLEWPNQLARDVAEGRAEPSSLAYTGMREQHCLGKRLRKRFPKVLSHSHLSYVFRSTVASRVEKSALSYVNGLLEETSPEAISLTRIEEKDDVWLRFDNLPCANYDQKITSNSSFKEWIDTFLTTPAFQDVIKNVQQHFNPDHWKLDAKDVLTFYDVCIHEMSLLKNSSWCDLFGTEDLAVMGYYTDLKAYWIKAGGYAITRQRSVHLVKSILDFLTDSKKPVALSFAHAETVLSLLGFFDAFPVPQLTPAGYRELVSRNFVTSRIAPYSANVYLVLYKCAGDASSGVQTSQLNVRLLVNEKPVRIGLCGGANETSHCHEGESEETCQQELFFCGLDLLKKRAYNATNGFSSLTELCKAAT